MLTLMILISLFSFQPCATEDSTQCYWNAQTQGNGEGTSFIAINDSIAIHFTNDK